VEDFPLTNADAGVTALVGLVAAFVTDSVSFGLAWSMAKGEKPKA